MLDRLDTRIGSLRDEVDRSSTRVYDAQDTRGVSLRSSVSELRASVDRMRTNFSLRRSTSANVQELLDRAYTVDQFIQSGRVSQLSRNYWIQITADINTLAGYYGVSPRWQSASGGPIVPGAGTWTYTVSDYQMRSLLNRLRTRTGSFRLSFDRWASRGGTRNDEAVVSNAAAELDAAVLAIRRDYSRDRSYDLGTILRSASMIDRYLSSNTVTRDVTNKWALVRSDLNTLTGYYGMNNWDWNYPIPGYPGYPTNTGGNGRDDRFDERITGTYRLNVSRSDNVANVVAQAVRAASYNSNQRERATANLERRLASPEMLAIQKNGNQIILSSPNGSQITLDANGVAQTETSPNGRTVKTTVVSTNRDFTINYEGDRVNDYFVNFAVAGNDQLRVTRRIYLENQNQTVTVNSVYDKTSPTPQWDLVGSYNGSTTNTGGTVNGFIIPNSTTLTATLDTPLSTRTARDGDRFRMTVNSPGQYAGAVIEGRVNGERSGIVSGQANLSFSFDTIRMRDGRTYNFAGIVDQVRAANGSVINVNNESTVRDDSQTTKTVTRAGIGAALGALIGAIASGGKGAAIGAVVGAGAGAGTVVLQGRDNLELASGSQFTITATAPANMSMR